MKYKLVKNNYFNFLIKKPLLLGKEKKRKNKAGA